MKYSHTLEAIQKNNEYIEHIKNLHSDIVNFGPDPLNIRLRIK